MNNLSTESYIAIIHTEASIHEIKAISLYFVGKHNLSTENYIAVFRTEEQFINWQLYHFMSCQTTIYQPIALILYFVRK